MLTLVTNELHFGTTCMYLTIPMCQSKHIFNTRHGYKATFGRQDWIGLTLLLNWIRLDWIGLDYI